MKSLFLLLAWILSTLVIHAQTPRVAFLGDSIMYGGRWPTLVESALRGTPTFADATIVNFGLSSETVSGLSEPGHAGGKFARPCLHERLDRILTAFRPTHVLACYGMNDGIYLPLDDEHQQAFQVGMSKLKIVVEKSGASFIAITAPLYRADQFEKDAINYDAVLDAQAAWLTSQKDWQVIDIRPDLRAAIAKAKKANPAFVYAHDKVHPGAEGHDFIAASVTRQLWRLWKLPDQPVMASGASLDLLSQRNALLKHAWLTETKHLRPGVPKGLPLPEAEAKAAEILQEYRKAKTAP